jgi:hypothetical protein
MFTFLLHAENGGMAVAGHLADTPRLSVFLANRGHVHWPKM